VSVRSWSGGQKKKSRGLEFQTASHGEEAQKINHPIYEGIGGEDKKRKKNRIGGGKEKRKGRRPGIHPGCQTRQAGGYQVKHRRERNTV